MFCGPRLTQMFKQKLYSKLRLRILWNHQMSKNTPVFTHKTAEASCSATQQQRDSLFLPMERSMAELLKSAHYWPRYREWMRENEILENSWRDRDRRVLLFLLMEVDIRHPAVAWNKAMSKVSWVTQISLHSNRPSFLSNRLPSFCPRSTAIYTCIYKPSESSFGSWHRLLC